MKGSVSISSNSGIISSTIESVTLSESMPLEYKIQFCIIAAFAFGFIPLQIMKSKEWYGQNIGSNTLVFALAYVMNLIFVSLPGRFDNSKVSPEGGPWKSLFAPASWAFLIWPIIYLLETILTLAVVIPWKKSTIISDIISKITPFWVAGNLFQCMWCLSFRSKFRSCLWFPASLLAGAAVSMITAISIVSSILNFHISNNINWGQGIIIPILFRLPISLHAGWLSAATLLNLNGWLSYKQYSQPFQVSFAFASVYIAGFLGTLLSLKFKDPFYALTVAWASAALSYQTTPERSNVKDIYPTVLLQSLSRTEDLISKFLTAVAFISATKLPESIF